MVNVPKELSVRIFLEIVLSAIGEEFAHSEEICGIVLSIRPRLNVVAVWHRSAEHIEAMQSLRNELERFFLLLGY